MKLYFKKTSLCKLSAIVFATFGFSACNFKTDKVQATVTAPERVSNVLGPFDKKCYYSFSDAPQNTQYHAVAMNVDVKENGSLKGGTFRLACKPQDKICQTDLPRLVEAVQLFNGAQDEVDNLFSVIQTSLIEEKTDEELKSFFVDDSLLKDLDIALDNFVAAQSALRPTPIDLERLNKSTNLAYVLKDKHWVFTSLGLEAKPIQDSTGPIPFSDPRPIGNDKKAFSMKYYRKGVGKKCRYGFDLDIIITDTDVTLSTPIRVDPLIGNDGGGPPGP